MRFTLFKNPVGFDNSFLQNVCVPWNFDALDSDGTTLDEILKLLLSQHLLQKIYIFTSRGYEAECKCNYKRQEYNKMHLRNEIWKTILAYVSIINKWKNRKLKSNFSTISAPRSVHARWRKNLFYQMIQYLFPPLLFMLDVITDKFFRLELDCTNKNCLRSQIGFDS